MTTEPNPQGQETVQVQAALNAAAGGDNELVGELLQQYRARLQHMLRLRLSPQLAGRVGVSDVLQDAYVDVAKRLPTFLDERSQDSTSGGDTGMPFFLWVRFLVGQQLARTHRFHLGVVARDAGREQAVLAGGVPGVNSSVLAMAIADSGPSPSGVASNNEARELLAEALEELDEVDREIIMLRHFEQLTNWEIAKLLGLSEPGASLRHLRALKRMQVVLNTKGLSFPGQQVVN